MNMAPLLLQGRHFVHIFGTFSSVPIVLDVPTIPSGPWRWVMTGPWRWAMTGRWRWAVAIVRLLDEPATILGRPVAVIVGLLLDVSIIVSVVRLLIHQLSVRTMVTGRMAHRRHCLASTKNQ